MRGSEQLVLVGDARVGIDDTRVPGDPDNPPDMCFKTNEFGDLPTCTYADGQWQRSYEGDIGMGGGGPGAGFAGFFVLALIVGIAITVWRVSTARRMARQAGMSES